MSDKRKREDTQQLSLYEILTKLSTDSHHKIQEVLKDRDDTYYNKRHKTLSMLTLRLCNPKGLMRSSDERVGDYFYDKLKDIVTKDMAEGSFDVPDEVFDA